MYGSQGGNNLLLQNPKTALVGRPLPSDLILFARSWAGLGWADRQQEEGKEQEKQTGIIGPSFFDSQVIQDYFGSSTHPPTGLGSENKIKCFVSK
jgi:hypothetical protein